MAPRQGLDAGAEAALGLLLIRAPRPEKQAVSPRRFASCGSSRATFLARLFFVVGQEEWVA